MKFQIKDRVDIIGISGFVPEGRFDVVNVSGEMITIQDRQTKQLQSIHQDKLTGFMRKGEIKWPK